MANCLQCYFNHEQNGKKNFPLFVALGNFLLFTIPRYFVRSSSNANPLYWFLSLLLFPLSSENIKFINYLFLMIYLRCLFLMQIAVSLWFLFSLILLHYMFSLRIHWFKHIASGHFFVCGIL